MRDDLDGRTHTTVDLLEQPCPLQRLASDRTKRRLGLGHIQREPKQKQTHEPGKGVARLQATPVHIDVRCGKGQPAATECLLESLGRETNLRETSPQRR